MEADRSNWSTTRIEALRATRELAACSDRHLKALLPYFDEVSVPAGTHVAREGEHCTEFAVVLRGRLGASALGTRPRTLVAGDSIGWTTMWDRSLNEETVVVAADARLLVMSHSQFRAVKTVALPPDCRSAPAGL
jgi:CRP-like cAMP-binding protein